MPHQSSTILTLSHPSFTSYTPMSGLMDSPLLLCPPQAGKPQVQLAVPCSMFCCLLTSPGDSPPRISYIICGAQCKVKIEGPLVPKTGKNLFSFFCLVICYAMSRSIQHKDTCWASVEPHRCSLYLPSQCMSVCLTSASPLLCAQA